MARSQSKQPTDAELRLLQILWESGPSELGPICARLRQTRDAATTTVATVLSIMLKKGLAKRSRGPNGWIWSANVSRGATARQMVDKILNHVFAGSAPMLMMHLIDGQVLSPQDLQELRELLEARDAPEAQQVPARKKAARGKACPDGARAVNLGS